MILPIVAAAIFLGRGFDIHNMRPTGSWIIDDDEIKKNIVKIPRALTQTYYRVTESSSDASDFLDIDGDLNLKIKEGKFSLEGHGQYLSKTVNRENTVEILINCYHETETETFPSHLKQTEWRSRNEVGTHYIRSITYGGQLTIQYLIKTNDSENMEEIKGAVSANLALSSSFDGSVKGSLEKISKQLGSKIRSELYAFATTGKVEVPQSLDHAMKLVQNYPAGVAKINKGKGSPLKFEVVSLNTLDSGRDNYVKNVALDALMHEAINKYEDIRITLGKYKPFQRRFHLTADQIKKEKEFSRDLQKANREFQKAITSLRGDGGLDQFDLAFKAYGEGAKNIPNRFSRELAQLEHEIEKKDYVWYPKTTAVTHYIHWGSVNCSYPSPHPVYIGLAASSPKGFGNGGSIECLPATRHQHDDHKFPDDTVVSHINGLNYKFPDGKTGPVLCASCRLANATTTFVVPASKECPEESKLEYSGLLMTGKGSGSTSRLVCVDSHPDHSIPEVTLGEDLTAATLEPVWALCDDEENCEDDDDRKYVNCVVCSR